jgi:membrane protease YdiL (CAAX protease family)
MLLGVWHVRQRPALTSNARGLLIVCGVEIALFGIIFTLGWLASRASREQLLLKWRPGWWVIPLGIGYSVAMRFAVGMIFAAIVLFLLATGLLPREHLQQFMAASRPAAERIVDVHAMRHSPAYFWLTVTLSSFVVAGLREEMWRAGTLAGMRALWPGAFADRNGQIAAMAVIAMVFGLAHLGLGLLPAALASLLGLFLGIIMVVHESIWPAVIAHGVFDATTFALLPSVLKHV